MKKNIMITLVVVTLIGMFLYVTNPSKADFRDFVEDEVDELIANEVDTSSNHLNKLLITVGSFLADGTAVIADNLYEREDYLFFSVYTMTIFDEEYQYLGIFRKFFDIDSSTND